MFARRPRYEMTKDLVAVAMGRRPADLVIRGGRWVNVCSGEIIAHTDIATLGSRIAYCGPQNDSLIGPQTEVIEAHERYLVPGFLDAHMHVESSMLTVSNFAAAVLPHGTTGAFIDPHEIANVLGLSGVKLMVEEAKRIPMQVYVQVPSCVPAAPGLETAGATIGPEEVAQAMTWRGVIGLGEVMNYLGVANGDESLHAEIAAALKEGGIVGGHYASPDLGMTFHAYAAGGPSDCHEGTRKEDAVARVRQGMYAIFRQGSAWHDVTAQVRAITEESIHSRHMLLCTDDRHPGTLISEGHMDDVVRLAIREGVPPITAIQMATLNTAEHFGVADDVGCIAPGRYADVLLVSDLEHLTIELVLAAGEVVAQNGTLTASLPAYSYPKEAKESVHLHHPLESNDFVLSVPVTEGVIRAHVMRMIENQVPNQAITMELPVREGTVRFGGETEVALVAVVDRHHASGRMGYGFVTGFGLKERCALASTVAHDSHNLLVMGTDAAAMAHAANRVAEMGGGVCLVQDDRVAAEIPLPIAGLMSEAPVEQVAAQAEALHCALRDCGCTLNNAFMTFSLLALPVIPQLRVTDHGLVDVEAFKVIQLFPDISE